MKDENISTMDLKGGTTIEPLIKFAEKLCNKELQPYQKVLLSVFGSEKIPKEEFEKRYHLSLRQKRRSICVESTPLSGSQGFLAGYVNKKQSSWIIIDEPINEN